MNERMVLKWIASEIYTTIEERLAATFSLETIEVCRLPGDPVSYRVRPSVSSHTGNYIEGSIVNIYEITGMGETEFNEIMMPLVGVFFHITDRLLPGRDAFMVAKDGEEYVISVTERI